MKAFKAFPNSLLHFHDHIYENKWAGFLSENMFEKLLNNDRIKLHGLGYPNNLNNKLLKK